MAWEVWMNGRVVKTFPFNMLDDAYKWAFDINVRSRKYIAHVQPRVK